MKIDAALSLVRRLGVDSAIFIYFAEAHPHYFECTEIMFARLDRRGFLGFTSTVTLTEVLTKPLKTSDRDAQRAYRHLLRTRHLKVVNVNSRIAERAAQLRATYNLKTPDAIQIATALESRCDAFLTNDIALKRVTDLRVLVLDELETT